MIHLEEHGAVTAIRMSRSFLRRPLCWTAAYWIEGLLIDSGPACTARELVRALGGRPVEQIVITHRHEDQIGGLAQLHREYPLARIYASRRTLPYIRQPDRLNLQFYRRIAWGKPAGVENVLLLDEVDNRIETANYLFRVIETPGHTPDHICLFEPTRRWLFSGDAYSGDAYSGDAYSGDAFSNEPLSGDTLDGGRVRALTPEVDLFASLGSLRTLASLRPERMFTGDGGLRRIPLPDLHAQTGQLMRLTRDVAKLDASGMTVSEMVAHLFEDEPAISFWSRGHFSAVNLIEACRSYNDIFLPDGAEGEESAERQTGGTGPSDSSQRQSPGRSDRVR